MNNYYSIYLVGSENAHQRFTLSRGLFLTIIMNKLQWLHKLINKIDKLILHIDVRKLYEQFLYMHSNQLFCLIIKYLFEYFMPNIYTHIFSFLHFFFFKYTYNVMCVLKHWISSSVPLIFINLINTFRFNFSYISFYFITIISI